MEKDINVLNIFTIQERTTTFINNFYQGLIECSAKVLWNLDVKVEKIRNFDQIVSFENTSNFNLNDLSNREDKFNIESDGWYYFMYKSVANIKPEIRIKRTNYKTIKDQPKGNRIDEEAWIYKEGMNRLIIGRYNNEYIHGKDPGFIINGFSIQNYIKKAF